MLNWTKPHRLINLVYIVFLVASIGFFISIAATIPSFPFSIGMVETLRVGCIVVIVFQAAYLGYCGWSLWRDREDYMFYYVHCVINVVIIIVTAAIVYATASQNRRSFYDDSIENCKTLIPEAPFWAAAVGVFCSDSCPCHLEQDNYTPPTWTSLNQNYTISDAGTTSVGGCSNFESEFDRINKSVYENGGNHYGLPWDYDDWLEEAKEEEEEYECALDCSESNFYIWSDSTKPAPHQTCFSVFIKKMKTFSDDNISMFFAFAVLQFLISVGIGAFSMDKTFGDDDSVFMQEVEVQEYETMVQEKKEKKKRKKEKRKQRFKNLFGGWGRKKQPVEEESDEDDSHGDQEEGAPSNGEEEKKQLVIPKNEPKKLK
eukprot:CAMPEP_0114998862 /NCGR_PEP_ID=MMETSP0216-20121206/15780_1 /TAXON_ID=223996 /ORGANISM="Protocruzia adherens, Strain Boccale" /LENGTH=372 /DNA_ID=CAMNT_0002363581 /DNA_START=87 /DNA_END=1205 /DNA_ORIENTATION=+